MLNRRCEAEPAPESLQYGGFYVRAGGLDILKFDKNCNWWGLGVLFGGLTPPKHPPAKGPC